MKRQKWLLFFLPMLLVTACQQDTPAPLTEQIILPPPPPVPINQIVTLLPPDSIQAIDEPQFETAVQANTHLRPDEKVIGVFINGEARAYPIPILSAHEIVNDTIGGAPVAVTWCPLCYSALVFSRQLEDQSRSLTFGVSGKLLQNTLIMYDRQTDSLWSQLYGGAVQGEFTGMPLAVFPSLLTEWEAWFTQYPDSQVLSKSLTCAQFSCGNYAENPRGSYAVDSYQSYYNMPDEGVIDRQIPRDTDSVSAKKRVLGVRVGQQTKAYPFELLNQRQLVHDEIDNVPVLVWFDPETQTGQAFIREVAGEVLTFTAVPNQPGLLQDEQTNSQWQGLTGQGVNGRYTNQQLPILMSTPAFEFGWYGYFPESETYSE